MAENWKSLYIVLCGIRCRFQNCLCFFLALIVFDFYSFEGSKTHFTGEANTYIYEKIETDIYYKPADSKQYLNFHSHHPRHTKVALPYNLSRRICTIVFDDRLRTIRLEEMKESLLECNYPIKLINDSIEKALNTDRKLLMSPISETNDQRSNDSIALVTTFSSNFTNNDNLVKKLYNNLATNETTSKYFQNKRVVLAKRQPSNLKHLLTN